MPDSRAHAQPDSRHSRTLRILTYNVHGCRGTDGRVDPARVAEVIARCGADIIALQELDVGRRRSGGIDQARAIAAHLNLTSHFHPALHLAEERYGDAILTALPSRVVRAGPLPSGGEPRGAIWVAVDIGGAELHVINTHFGLRRRERMAQAATILGPGWAGDPRCVDGLRVLLGDFNAVPRSGAYRLLARDLSDAQHMAGGRGRATFPSRLPLLRLDHIFVGDGIAAPETVVRADTLARVASDHLPLVATLRIELPASAARRLASSAAASAGAPAGMAARQA